MRTRNLSTWLLRGTYPRLYLPIVLIILVVTGVRYHYLLGAETDEVRRHAATELQRAGNTLLPLLSALPANADADSVTALLRPGAANLARNVHTLKWQAGEQAAVEVIAPLGTNVITAPDWFVQWMNLAPPVQQFAHTTPDRQNARLTVTLHTETYVQDIWSTVVVQARISALNILTILVLLTLLLRANARMLRRLAEATDAFRQGHLGTRM